MGRRPAHPGNTCHQVRLVLPILSHRLQYEVRWAVWEINLQDGLVRHLDRAEVQH
jgi:hypothetical protein